MSTQLRLNDFSTTPLYNIKAVVHATGISPSTLRAWERRYQMCRPQRSESGYRLYSERDMAVIRWLKSQVDAGMAISQAVAWYDNLVEQSETGAVILPMTSSGASVLETLNSARPSLRSEVRDYGSLCRELIDALLSYDEESAERVVSESFALYTVEEVGESLFLPVLVEIGDRWRRGEVGVTTEHYATNYLLQRLTTLLRAVPNRPGGPLIWIACAPGELHEVGAVLLSLYLRRLGQRVRYLGQDLPGEDLVHEIRKHNPSMILFSASTSKTAQALDRLTARLAQLSPRPIIGYGGQIFNRHQELRNHITGVFMGASAEEGVVNIQELLDERPVRDNGHKNSRQNG